MKICVSLMLLTFLSPGGCPPGCDFDLNTVQKPSYFANSLKVAADLNSEFEQSLMNLKEMKNQQANSNNNCDTTAEDKTDQESDCDNDDDQQAEQNSLLNQKLLQECQEQSAEREEKEQPAEVENFVGSNLFDGNRKQCFSPEDTGLLQARRDFELLIPKDLPKGLVNDEMLEMLLNYFYNGNQMLQRIPKVPKQVVEKAYYDMLGGYLRSYMVPVAKYSFYAGQSSLRSVSGVISLYEQCKAFLNTNGNGWKPPIGLSDMKSMRIESLKGATLGSESSGSKSSCSRLQITSGGRSDNSAMLVPLPRLEQAEGELENIWLPFKKRRSFDLRSPKSAYILVRFYETVIRCYSAQSRSPSTFNSNFKTWLSDSIFPHLSDEEFYPGLGAVLKIYENLRGSSRDGGDNCDRVYRGTAVEKIAAEHDRSKDSDGDFSDSDKEHKSDNNMFSNYREYKKSRKICEKSTKKPKCKPTLKPKSGSFLAANEQYIKYLYWFLALILLILFIILLLALCSRCLKSGKGEQGKGFKGFFNMFKCGKKPGDEEILIKPDSASIMPRRSSTSTSSLACQPAAKCIPCSKRGGGGKSSGGSAPIIETTSLDYSSSEPDSKSKKKPKGKIVTIDEKKSAPPPASKKRGAKEKTPETTSNDSKASKKSSLTKSSSESAAARKRSKSPKTSKSWETMYDS